VKKTNHSAFHGHLVRVKGLVRVLARRPYKGARTAADTTVMDGTATQGLVYSFFVDHLFLLQKCLSGKRMGITLLVEEIANVALGALVDLRSTQLSKENTLMRSSCASLSPLSSPLPPKPFSSHSTF
jgi:hypothetical protein